MYGDGQGGYAQGGFSAAAPAADNVYATTATDSSKPVTVIVTGQPMGPPPTAAGYSSVDQFAVGEQRPWWHSPSMSESDPFAFAWVLSCHCRLSMLIEFVVCALNAIHYPVFLVGWLFVVPAYVGSRFYSFWWCAISLIGFLPTMIGLTIGKMVFMVDQSENGFLVFLVSTGFVYHFFVSWRMFQLCQALRNLPAQDSIVRLKQMPGIFGCF